ncbi:Mo-dependent nitrogenase C-terminal domain-containing protein [Limnofasciculus baicalensis]|uniref:Mo-dependent nitrogenase C-terminal domain-containing protein n=1 Tax=Limnofasciculus baicalensis BBK-W-15 TaxID=2699891 RepID=A0AAE3GX31_9CYAN|nr:Mo-dependent nitrogenase C-terminal domain-containing protein [Limnofasciculus baicalensis]MCP2731667.1 Mo-dependent nitrogenase C-terminal domain-containing protein [Limnofasciculus baicalensis BBK-W-15]
MNVSQYTTKKLILTSWIGSSQGQSSLNDSTSNFSDIEISTPHSPLQKTYSPLQPKKGLDLLKPVKQWLDSIEIHNEKQADLICQVIPAQCPFEREIKVFGRTLLRIPPLCKLNPIYDELVGLRFRALCYLVDECGK